MTAAFVWGGAALVLLGAGLLPLCVELSRNEEGFTFGAGFPFLPPRPAGKRSRDGAEEKSSKNLPSPPILKILAKNGYTTLCYIASRLRVDILKIHFTAAGPDPAATAAAYAAAGLAMDALLELGGGRIAGQDLRADLDFDAERPELLLHIRLTMRIYRLLAAAAVFGFGFLRDYIRYKKGKDK